MTDEACITVPFRTVPFTCKQDLFSVGVLNAEIVEMGRERLEFIVKFEK